MRTIDCWGTELGILSEVRRVLWRLGIPIAAAVGGVVGFVPIFALGLGVPIFVPGPLALGTAALLATLAAGWVGNIAPPAEQQHTRSRLLAILGASVGGVILALLVGVALLFIVPRLLSISDPYAMINVTLAIYAVCLAILALAASLATWRLRAPNSGGLGFDGAAALGLSVAGPIILSPLIPVMGSGGTQSAYVQAGSGVGLALAAAGAALMAWRLRRGPEGHGLGRDAALTLIMVGVWTAVTIGAVHLSCRFVFAACVP